MSDYIPNDPPRDPRDPRGYDRNGNARFEPVEPGRGPYILLAILVAIAMVGGLLYFNGGPRQGADVATMPDRTTTLPATPSLPGTTVTPAPTPEPATRAAPAVPPAPARP